MNTISSPVLLFSILKNHLINFHINCLLHASDHSWLHVLYPVGTKVTRLGNGIHSSHHVVYILDDKFFSYSETFCLSLTLFLSTELTVLENIHVDFSVFLE